MADLLDRTFQRELLLASANEYPRAFALKDFGTEERVLRVNVAYLDEHGLVAALYPNGHGRRAMPIGATITAKGIDFLSDDGGLSAILGVVTVRLHEETLKSLIELKIQESDLPPVEKTQYVEALRKLPGEATKHLALKLIDAGLSNWPVAMQALQTWLTR